MSESANITVEEALEQAHGWQACCAHRVLAKEVERLRKRIAEVASVVATQYPDIETVDAIEQLYAVESGYKGTNAAVGDWERYAKELGRRLGYDGCQMLEVWRKM